MVITPTIIVAVVLVLIVLFYVVVYNGFISSRQQVENAWSGIDVQLKKRYDLVPQLVNIVKGYAKHEKDTLEDVTKMRADAISAGGSAELTPGRLKSENMLTGALRSIFAVSENYPDLKANENFLQLQTELSGIEDNIAASRRIYNSNVTDWNTRVQSIPSNFVALVHSFVLKTFFEADESEKGVVDIKF